MTRRQKEPLRALTSEERQELERIARATSESATRVTRAKALLAVAQGHSYTTAAQACGRRSGDAIAQLVGRFNREGLAALTPRHGGGAKIQYTAQQRQQILALAQQQPELAIDGVSQWSLMTLQQRLRTSGGDKFVTVSTYTIGQVLHED
jgi:transposase